MVDKKEITEKLLNQFFEIAGTYTISPEGLVNVKGSVTYTADYERRTQASLPVAFGHIEGDFWATSKKLKNWKNFPQTVSHLFVVSGNKFKDWNGCPTKVGSLIAGNNQFDTLVGMPEVAHSLDLKECKLKNLEGMRNYIQSWISVQDNPLENFDGFVGCDGYISFTWSPHLPVLKTLLAKGGVRIYDPRGFDANQEFPSLGILVEILNKYAGQGKRAIFDCQKDLEDAGFEGNARW